ncbi:MAG: S41 family peptidase [Defluviitaleaceae bacterium]|nr:S41 family peptidase [Defluviitaleaceae bacterium]
MKKGRKFLIVSCVLVLAIAAGFFALNMRGAGSNFSKDELLYDFDFMVQTMEETFPYFGVAQRRLGIDIRELAAETRVMIENYPQSMQHVAQEQGIALNQLPPMDEHIFWSIVRHEFFGQFAPFANAQMLSFEDHQTLWSFYTPPALATGSAHYIHNAMLFTHPNVRGFYERQQEHAVNLAYENPNLFRFIFREDPTTQQDRPPVLTTEIIEEGRIAYLNLSTFFTPNLREHSHPVDRFFMAIYDYDHLIIDIRDNDGGRIDFARMIIMHTIWANRDIMPPMPLYAFYRDTERARTLAEAHIDTEGRASRFMPQSDHPLAASDILAQSSLPHLNQDDMRGLGFGTKFDAGLDYLSSNDFHFAQERMWIPRHILPFEGQVWLLTSETNRQASAMFARQARYMDFATLVGEQTSGGYTSTVMTHFSLPNTSILVSWDIDYLVDEHGRALEEFPTQPHYFNRPGMDALETVLQMIAEGNY